MNKTIWFLVATLSVLGMLVGVAYAPGPPVGQNLLNAIFNIVTDIQTETDKIQTIKTNQFVPFRESLSRDKVCDSPDAGSITSFLTIKIDNTALFSSILVTSVGVSLKNNIDASDTVQVSNYISSGGSITNALTVDLTGSNLIASRPSFELLGQPLVNGINSPTQIGGATQGANDITFTLACNAGTSGNDVEIDFVIVSGWKPARTAVNIDY